MQVISKMVVHGKLPCGLMINCVHRSAQDLPGADVAFCIPALRTNSYTPQKCFDADRVLNDLYSVISINTQDSTALIDFLPIKQATDRVAVMLEGEFTDPALVFDLTLQGVQSSHWDQASIAHPCIILNSPTFKGIVKYCTGSEIPRVILTASTSAEYFRLGQSMVPRIPREHLNLCYPGVLINDQVLPESMVAGAHSTLMAVMDSGPSDDPVPTPYIPIRIADFATTVYSCGYDAGSEELVLGMSIIKVPQSWERDWLVGDVIGVNLTNGLQRCINEETFNDESSLGMPQLIYERDLRPGSKGLDSSTYVIAG